MAATSPEASSPLSGTFRTRAFAQFSTLFRAVLVLAGCTPMRDRSLLTSRSLAVVALVVGSVAAACGGSTNSSSTPDAAGGSSGSGGSSSSGGGSSGSSSSGSTQLDGGG